MRGGGGPVARPRHRPLPSSPPAPLLGRRLLLRLGLTVLELERLELGPHLALARDLVELVLLERLAARLQLAQLANLAQLLLDAADLLEQLVRRVVLAAPLRLGRGATSLGRGR